ncbi:hypothetical protein FRB90_010134 [Tulasnella sp. 427]|nr:hypothetical protein FRB90_010134 [Tulasnella sp. 427]
MAPSSATTTRSHSGSKLSIVSAVVFQKENHSAIAFPGSSTIRVPRSFTVALVSAATSDFGRLEGNVEDRAHGKKGKGTCKVSTKDL